MFQNFNIDHSSVQIDKQVIERPGYISVTEWIKFWELAIGDGLRYDEGFQAARDEFEC